MHDEAVSSRACEDQDKNSLGKFSCQHHTPALARLRVATLAQRIKVHGICVCLLVPMRTCLLSSLKLCFTEANETSLSKRDANVTSSPLNISVSPRLLGMILSMAAIKLSPRTSITIREFLTRRFWASKSSSANPRSSILSHVIGFCTYTRICAPLVFEVGSYSS